MRKLYRLEKGSVFAGVFSGLGEYFSVDPVILRFAFVFMSVFSAIIPGVIVYIFGMIIIPKHVHTA